MIFSLQEMFVRRSDCRTTCTVHRSSVDEFCPGRKMSAKQQASQALGARGQRSTPLRNTKHLVEIVPPGIDKNFLRETSATKVANTVILHITLISFPELRFLM
mmetsp:Transcript_31543/g.51244  ORF Transcript_31543/g.51244 Transcript_31543/m.51244 type:complete len:103 (-) Transcript_31543:145-453(-)